MTILLELMLECIESSLSQWEQALRSLPATGAAGQ